MNLQYDINKDSSIENLDILRKKIHPKLFFFKKEILRALKKAKRFEFQKISKRIRNERSADNITILDRLKEELLVVKDLDLEAIKDFLLYINCLKEPLLFQIIHIEPVNSPLKNVSEPVKNVINRIFNSNSVKKCIKRVIFSLKKIAKIQDDTIRPKNPQKNKGNSLKDPLILNNKSKDNEEGNTESLNEKNKEKNQDILEKKAELKIKNDIQLKSKKKQNIEEKLKNLSGSTFLPSLSAGYISGSDDNNDIDTEYKDIDKPKKNRRGQRARRKIWEMKYGKNARHLQVKRKKMNSNENIKLSYNNNKSALINRENKEVKPLHPSWEAARRLKKKESSNIKFEGTKIKFE
ncbi:hypothetical protein T552_02456 [Pneumocystis carinii B80]|uniref:Bud22 domain-containing protein n=1 Tax=Pneumocystis carinii (strain B80) TaxID=1408658 RepID=A0A0W4ZF28_PNEC8|nr:hypothetical protein T552_02456 [Pneumocystis carinii B80]KTW26965.1 hypothetical protein T552_02456 [Pneumocystis carinii B80]